MFWSLITALVAAFAGAGIGMTLRHLSRKRLPTSIIPISAALAMFISTVALEYQWAGNVLSTMAPDTVVISEREQQAWYQPWTYVRPWVRGFIGFSPDEVVETAEGSGILVVQMRRQERWQPQMVIPNLVDCQSNRRAELRPETDINEDGQPLNANWRDVPASDPIVSAVCREAASG